MTEHQQNTFLTFVLLAFILGALLGFGFKGAIEPDARTQALDWFAGMSLEEQSDFIYVQLRNPSKQRGVAQHWCSTHPNDSLACGKAGMGSPVFKGWK